MELNKLIKLENEILTMAENDDWFDDYAANYVEPESIAQKKRDLQKGWYGKSEILKWDFHGTEETYQKTDEIEELVDFEKLSDVYSKDYWNTDGLEDDGAFFFPEGTENLYQMKGSEDVFMYDFGDRKVLFYVYEIKDIHKRKEVITISGWDYNVIIDLKDKTIETHYTR
jgi:hypothetical protein